MFYRIYSKAKIIIRCTSSPESDVNSLVLLASCCRQTDIVS